MFWKINFRQPSAIDGLLEKEDCTLNEILDEDDVLQECKTQNKKLVELPENLEMLVHYVCDGTEAEMDDKTKFKYPHLSCEILTSEVFSITEAIGTSDMLMSLLWSFLNKEFPINPLTGSKVLGMLLNQRTSVFMEYVQKREQFVDKFLRHLGTSALMDLLLQMITAPDGDQHRSTLTNVAVSLDQLLLDVRSTAGQHDVYLLWEHNQLLAIVCVAKQWLKEELVVEKLIDFIHPSASIDQCINASQALCDMIRISRETSQTSGPSPLLSVLENKETLVRLLSNMFTEASPPDWVIINGISVLLTSLERRINSPYSPTFGHSHASQDDIVADQMIEKAVAAISPKLMDFQTLLLRKPQCDSMVTSIGSLQPPLGNMRLQVIRMFSALLHTHNFHIQQKFIANGTFNLLLDLFFSYPWNNFLHAQVESCVTAALNSNTPITSINLEDTTTLRHHILKGCSLVEKLLDGAESNDRIESEGNGCRQGYMGHLIRMANQVAGNTRALGMATATLHSKEDIMTNAIDDSILQSALDESTYQRWSRFIAGPVAEINKKNDTNLGGTRPLTSSIDDSDEEFEQLSMAPDNELEKAFLQYQECRFSAPFIEEFGPDDELNPDSVPYSFTYANMTSISCKGSADEEHTQYMAGLEAALAERVQQFDDLESDDESSNWADREMSFTSPAQQESSDDEEPKMGKEQFSDEGDSLSEKRGRTIVVKETQTTSPSDIDVISWHSEFATNEDLSLSSQARGIGNAVEIPVDWTQEPNACSSEADSWGDFNPVKFDDRNSSLDENPKVVSVTYVSVKDMEKDDAQPDLLNYSKIPHDASTEDENVLHHNTSNTSDSDMANSSDEEVSGGYSFNSDGDSLLVTSNSDIDSTPVVSTVEDGDTTTDKLSISSRNNEIIDTSTDTSVIVSEEKTNH